MNKMKSFLRKGFYVVWAGCIINCGSTYVGGVVLATGPSMQPTVTEDDVLLVEVSSVRKKQVQRGHIITALSPQDPTNLVCKRVKGLQYDKIWDEKTSEHFYIPKGHVWLEGDNKEGSNDSREYGPVPYGLLQGKVCYRIFPPSRFGRIE